MNDKRASGVTPAPGPPASVPDPLSEAEALREALAEVGQRAGRLITSLRHFHKQQRALHAAWRSFRNLDVESLEDR